MKTFQFFALPDEGSQMMMDVAELYGLAPSWLDQPDLCPGVQGGETSAGTQSNGRERLICLVGELREAVLTESAISAPGCNVSTWRSITRSLSKHLRSGLWVINPNTRVKEFYRTMKYTEGAHAAWLNGVSLRQFFGSQNYVEIGETGDNALLTGQSRVIVRF